MDVTSVMSSNFTITPTTILLSGGLVIGVILFRYLNGPQKSQNPLAEDARQLLRPRKEGAERDKIIKQGFAQKRIPTDLDTICIGSGISSLATAALLSKSGQRVLVLEQHDQAGGCCHTFIERGYEFDVGIHYVGKVHTVHTTRTLLDQISDGQIRWQPLDDNYDTMVLGEGDSQMRVNFRLGEQGFRSALLDAFPEERVAIDTFIRDCKKASDSGGLGLVLLKVLPRVAASFLWRSGLLNLFTGFLKWTSTTTEEYLNHLTDNVNLRAALAYCYGDYGTPPDQSCFLMHASLITHFFVGGSYPVGGASEIALNIIPVIERAGGKMLVRANVTQILFDSTGKAIGVQVTKGGEQVDIFANNIVSSVGLLNTFNLMPPKICSSTSLSSMVEDKLLRNGTGALSLFVGLRGSAEELGLKAQNIWALTSPELSKVFRDFLSRDFDADNMPPLPILFLSFPSAKDPTWAEREPDKTTCTVVTLANWSWFSQWTGAQVKHRGADYERIKDVIATQMWKQVLQLYPQLEDRVDYFNLGTPISNDYYIGSNRGEMYGLDHNKERFRPDVSMQLRPDIGVPGLYLTGQDIVTCGFSSGLNAGLLTASVLLKRNLLTDCQKLHDRIYKGIPSKALIHLDGTIGNTIYSNGTSKQIPKANGM